MLRIASAMIFIALFSFACERDDSAAKDAVVATPVAAINQDEAQVLAINHLHELYRAAGHTAFEAHCETVRQNAVWLSDCWERFSEWSFAIRVTDDGEVEVIAGEIPGIVPPFDPPIGEAPIA